MAKLAEPMMIDGGTLLTMSYYGSARVVPTYGIMGPIKAALECSVKYLAYDLGPKKIRVHAVSPGPIKTRAGSGIREFDALIEQSAQAAPLKPDNASKAANAKLCRVLLLLSNIETSISGYGERHTGGSPAQPQRMTAHNHNSDSSEAIHTLQSDTPITSRCR